jgi:hypothetical protein
LRRESSISDGRAGRRQCPHRGRRRRRLPTPKGACAA